MTKTLTERKVESRRTDLRAILADDPRATLSDIARELRCSRDTVARDMRAIGFTTGPLPNIQDENGKPINGQQAGAPSRATTHGAYSELAIGPLREKRKAELAATYSWIDDARLSTQAQRLAMIERGSWWLDERGGVVRDRTGKVFDIATKVATWMKDAEAWFTQAEAERTDHKKAGTLAGYLEGGDE